MSNPRLDMLRALVRDVPDFPQPGVVFKDITPLLASPHGFQASIEELVASAPRDIDVVVGMEARGFILAAPVALALGLQLLVVGDLSGGFLGLPLELFPEVLGLVDSAHGWAPFLV